MKKSFFVKKAYIKMQLLWHSYLFLTVWEDEMRLFHMQDWKDYAYSTHCDRLFKRKNALYKSLVRAKPRSPKPIALTVRGELFILVKAPLTFLTANNAETSCLPVIKNNIEIVKMLIEGGADVNASIVNGFTPII